MKKENAAPAKLEALENHGQEEIPWSGLSFDQARELTDGAGEPRLPRIAKTLKARIDTEPRSPVDAGESYRAVDHALLYAYELKGRRLHAQAAGEILIALPRLTAGLVQRFVLSPLKRWNERSRRRGELSRLDDRMLRDVGLSRADIGFVALYGTHPSRGEFGQTVR